MVSHIYIIFTDTGKNVRQGTKKVPIVPWWMLEKKGIHIKYIKLITDMYEDVITCKNSSRRYIGVLHSYKFTLCICNEPVPIYPSYG